MHRVQKILVGMLQLPIRLYRYLLSPFLGNCCRFHPSCSQYALQALARHGVVNGLWLTMKRLLRCAPWGDCGIDEVPQHPPLSWSRLVAFFKFSSHSEKL